MFHLHLRHHLPSTEKKQFKLQPLHNILRLFDVLPNFLFTTSEAVRDFYLETWYIRVASRVAERLRFSLKCFMNMLVAELFSQSRE